MPVTIVIKQFLSLVQIQPVLHSNSKARVMRREKEEKFLLRGFRVESGEMAQWVNLAASYASLAT